MALGEAVARWSEAGGYREEQHWTSCTERVLRQPFEKAEHRLVSELSGGERKRLALEVLLDSDVDALLLDEPDNFLDLAGKRWLEESLKAARKTILLVSHDRELLSRAPSKLVTIEANGAWTHGGNFATYHDARDARNARLGDAVSRWQQEERRLFRHYKLMKQRAALNDSNQGQANAAESRWERWVQAGPPPEPPQTRGVTMRLQGGRSGKRVLECAQLEIAGLTEPFDLSVWFGERVAVLGPNGTGKSHFLRLLGGAAIDHAGEWKLGAEVRPRCFIRPTSRKASAARRRWRSSSHLPRSRRSSAASRATAYGNVRIFHSTSSAAGNGRACRSSRSSSDGRIFCCSTNRPIISTSTRPRRCKMPSNSSTAHCSPSRTTGGS